MNSPSTTRLASRPIVLVPADNRMLGQHPYHVVGKKYVDAVRLAGCLPLVVPWAAADEVDELLLHAHGVLLTGSASNVHPSHFG
ncbi:MAG TPA: gamma-glutamyl-gamma-aminobutyrate hydrolase family protein, partial [Casimicrobiaceae bacterium]